MFDFWKIHQQTRSVEMKIKGVMVLGFILASAMGAFAQDYAKVEIPIVYSYMRFNPEDSNIVGGFSLNGGGGGIVYYINHSVGIEAEFNGYSSSSRLFQFPRASTSICPAGCTVTADANLFTYNFGPVFKPIRKEHFEPFVETLFGGAHSNTYANAIAACQNACAITSSKPSNNAWDFVIGGGVDIPVTKSISIRPAQFDFVLTRFNNVQTVNHQNQSNFRYQAGLILRF
jgi:hypothetical protein